MKQKTTHLIVAIITLAGSLIGFLTFFTSQNWMKYWSLFMGIILLLTSILSFYNAYKYRKH